MGSLILMIIVGLFIGWVISGYRRYESLAYDTRSFKNFELSQEHLAQSELGLFVALAAKVAKADGHVDTLEAELISNMLRDVSKVFPDPEHARDLLKKIFNLEKEQKYNLDDTAFKLYKLIGRDAQKRMMMMQFFVVLAFADGHLSASEENMLYKIAAFLHFSQEEIESLISQVGSMGSTQATSERSIEEAYALLGVSASDDMKTIKKAYRKLVKQYHPDIIQAQGKDASYIQEANAKMQEINTAYEMIKKLRD